MDHKYSVGEKRKLVCNRETQRGDEEPLAHAILTNDTSSVLYTGLPLSVFFDHVKYLQQFSGRYTPWAIFLQLIWRFGDYTDTVNNFNTLERECVLDDLKLYTKQFVCLAP